MQDERSPEKRSTPARLVLVDDHHLLRRGFRSLLAGEPDLEVVGEASSGREAIELCERLHPDFVLMDVRMPEMDGLAATREIKREHPNIAVLILTMHENTDYLLEALDAGAAGYVLKEGADDELVDAVRQVAAGSTYLHPSLGAALAAAPPTPPGPPDDLTDRELDVLRLIALGHTNAEIAQQLYLSVRTVESHRAHIQRKLGRSTRAELVRYALDHDLVAAD